MKVALIRMDGWDAAMLAASCCVSSEMPTELKRGGLMRAVESGHLSILEHVAVTFTIEGISRACSHQLVRHRLASYCVSGDTRIRTSSQKTNDRTIRELYDLTPQYFNNLELRCVDESNGDIRYNRPLEIVYSGIKPTYIVRTVHGYEIRTTKEHGFLTENGWKALEDIEVGERVYINGQNSYKDKDWLYEMYHVRNMTQQDIADICGVSKDCIRSWVRKHGIQKESGTWSIGVDPPNKGKTKENYEPMRRTSEKMMGNHNPAMFRRGADKIGSWKGDDITDGGFRARTARIMYPKRTNVCELCGFHGVTEFHHMNKDLTEYDTNLIELCVSCHKAIHRKEITQRIVLSEITSINYYGYEDTYDVIMPDPYHNFIADGFVVHNSQQSQRYVNMEDFGYVMPETIKEGDVWFTKEVRGEIVEASEDFAHEFREYMSYAQSLYSDMVEAGIPEEDARYVLPNACCTNLVVTMNLRELSHFLGLRRCARAQDEIRALADEMARQVLDAMFDAGILVKPSSEKEWEPQTAFLNLLMPQCHRLGFCPEKNGCGKFGRKEA